MTNEQMLKLDAKYTNKLPKMLRVFYLWKLKKGKKGGNDYMSILQPWVEQSVSNGNSGRSRIEMLNEE